MNSSENIKQSLLPSKVALYYLGQPVKSDRLGMWYISPFRNERTASFLVNDIKGIHDFGTSMHYDIISFVQELFRIDFKTAVKKLSYDFGIIDYKQSSKEFNTYLIKKREEELSIKQNLNKWFNNTFSRLCDEIHMWERAIPHLRGDALSIAYDKQFYLDYLIDIFINATENNKIELYKSRGELEKWIICKN